MKSRDTRSDRKENSRKWVEYSHPDEDEDQLPVFANETLMDGTGRADPNLPNVWLN